MDNASCHIIDNQEKYLHVKVHFLLSNTTTFLQPIDAGVIQVFKMQYKKLYLLKAIGRYDLGITDWYKVDILEAVRMIANAWDNVSKKTVSNC